MEPISRARAIQNFLDRIDFSKKVNHNPVTVVEAVTTSFQFDTPVEFIIQAQFENFFRLAIELEQTEAIRPEAKQKYQVSLRELQRVVQYPILFQSAEAAKRSIVEPNHWVLPLLDDRLGSFTHVEDETKLTLQELAQKLSNLEAELGSSDLEPKLRAVLAPLLSQLSTLIRNYEIFGFEKAWETASATLFTVFKLAKTDEPQNSGWLQKTAVTVAAVLGILTTVEAGVKKVVSIGTQAKEFYEFLTNSEQATILRIEHKKDARHSGEEVS